MRYNSTDRGRGEHRVGYRKRDGMTWTNYMGEMEGDRFAVCKQRQMDIDGEQDVHA